MEKDLKDKVVVITGGAVGIGYEIADKYLDKEAKVAVLLDINEHQGAEAVKALTAKHGKNKAAFYKCDVIKDLDEIFHKIIDTYKNVDVLVNNAGILDDTATKKTIDINVTALIEWSMKFWEHMRKEKGGKGGTIINLASIYGFRIDQFLPIYQASKFAVMGFTKSLGHKYNADRTGVRVVAICPGFTETKLTSNPKTWKDQQLQLDFFVFLKGLPWQKVDAVGKAAVDVFESAESGTAWLIEGGKPIVPVP
ncbi:hypothetical protein O0L34_g18021 [Tuta absoluta]|nr:hypothetical protein O0L34_g18021 [Tuta absoluta]